MSPKGSLITRIVQVRSGEFGDACGEWEKEFVTDEWSA